MKLYELAAEWDAVKKMLDMAEETGNDADYADAVAIASTIGGEFDDKVESIACLIKELAADAASIKAEADALTKRARAKSKSVDNLKNYLLTCMVQADLRKVDKPRACVSIRKSKALSVVDVAKLVSELEQAGHQECVKYKEPEVDKNGVKALIASGSVFENAEIVENESAIIK